MPDQTDRDYLDKILQQFESSPYPDIAIEQPLNDDIKRLYDNSLVTARYRRDKTVITDLENRAILDVACGTGATTLRLAWANPGAKIVGVDISPESVKIAEKRLKHHGFENAEFHVLAIEDLEELAQRFDFINASDVLYFLPDLGTALGSFTAVLKPDGIVRCNLHSYYQRFNYYRAQALFQRMGLMEDNPEETDVNIVREFYEALKDGVDLKNKTWSHQYQLAGDQGILMNHLLVNDKGYTMAQICTTLRESGLQLFSMVDWKDWDWRKLFKEPNNLPAYLAMGLESSDLEEQLCFYELIQPDKRLLDFWCGHPQTVDITSWETWQEQEPEKIVVHLHPCLRSEALRQSLMDLDQIAPLNLNLFFPLLNQDLFADRTLTQALYLPLLESPQTLTDLIAHWLKVLPVNPVTYAPTEQEATEKLLKILVEEQEAWGVLLVELRNL